MRARIFATRNEALRAAAGIDTALGLPRRLTQAEIRRDSTADAAAPLPRVVRVADVIALVDGTWALPCAAGDDGARVVAVPAAYDGRPVPAGAPTTAVPPSRDVAKAEIKREPF